jgi:hypothetical protein
MLEKKTIFEHGFGKMVVNDHFGKLKKKKPVTFCWIGLDWA